MPTFLFHPEHDGPHPVVLYLMDAPGIRPALRDMASRLATAGVLRDAPVPVLPRWPVPRVRPERRGHARPQRADGHDHADEHRRRRRGAAGRRRQRPGRSRWRGRRGRLLHERRAGGGAGSGPPRAGGRGGVDPRGVAGPRHADSPHLGSGDGARRGVLRLVRPRPHGAARDDPGDASRPSRRQVCSYTLDCHRRRRTASPRPAPSATTTRRRSSTGSASTPCCAATSDPFWAAFDPFPDLGGLRCGNRAGGRPDRLLKLCADVRSAAAGHRPRVRARRR